MLIVCAIILSCNFFFLVRVIFPSPSGSVIRVNFFERRARWIFLQDSLLDSLCKYFFVEYDPKVYCLLRLIFNRLFFAILYCVSPLLSSPQYTYISWLCTSFLLRLEECYLLSICLPCLLLLS